MGIVIRRSGYTAMLSYLGFFIGYVNMLWLFPYAFSAEEIGLIRLMLAVSTMFSTIAAFGGSQIATRYFPYFADNVNRRSAFFKFLCIIAVSGVLIFTALFFFFHTSIISIYSKKSPLLINFLWYLIPLTASLILYVIIEAFVVVQKYPLIPALLREIYTRAILTIGSFIFLAALISFSGFIGLVCLLYCIQPILLFWYANSKNLLHFTGTIKDIQRKEFNEIAEYGFFIFLGNAGATLLANIDSVILSAYSGLTSTGIYGIAMFIAVIIEIPKRSLSQVVIPLVVQANKDNDVKTLDVLYKKSSINQFLIGVLIFLVIWINIDSIFSLIPHGEIYREGKWVVLFISLAKLYDMLTGINSEIVGTSRYYKIDLLFFTIISIIGISLNFLLIPAYGINGAALAVLASTFLYNTTRFIFIAIVMKIQPFTKKIIVALISALATYGIAVLIPSFNSTIIDIFIKTIAICLVLGGLTLAFRISEDISMTFKKIILRFNYSR